MAKIHRTIEEINLEGLDIPDKNVRMLNTKEFSEEERENRLLDFVGGFELMDNEIRMLVVEGVGGKGRSMNKFYRANERQKPNSRRFKLLYNPQVKFKNRLYLDFNVSIKKIKLRNSLTDIMSHPDVFLRSKVPEEIYDTLQKLAEMRKFDRIKYLRDYDLFPETNRLLSLERKYGDSLTYEDIWGEPERSKRQKKLEEEDARRKAQEEEERQQRELAMSKTQMKKSKYETKVKGATECYNPDYEETLKQKKYTDFI